MGAWEKERCHSGNRKLVAMIRNPVKNGSFKNGFFNTKYTKLTKKVNFQFKPSCHFVYFVLN